ncbi:MAG TPA: TIGR02301 family protein [Aquamicrobium sp.]|jgi:uncharacterized protein (TIGR02301 family)|nr:TIGR02301 family protein [Aquamicrobium sp.]
MKKRLAVIAVLALAALANGAKAAESPFEADLMRLSEILGALHYLRNLCGENGQDWRKRMEALLEAENPDEARRARLTASFNRGYRGFETTYTTCTASALTAISRYMKEGEALSRDTATRYGN